MNDNIAMFKIMVDKYGSWLLLVILVAAVAAVWSIAHVKTASGAEVSIFWGLVKYVKGADAEGVPEGPFASGNVTAPSSTLMQPPPDNASGQRIEFAFTKYTFGQGVVRFLDNNEVEVLLDNTNDVTGFGIANHLNFQGAARLRVDVSYNQDAGWLRGDKLFKVEIDNNVVRAINDSDPGDPSYVVVRGAARNGRIEYSYLFDISNIKEANKLQIVVAPAARGIVTFFGVRTEQ